MENDINNLNICMNGLKKDLEYIKESMLDYHSSNKEEHEKIIVSLDRVIENSNKKYAGKWTEKVIVWLGIGVGGALVAKFMNLI